MRQRFSVELQDGQRFEVEALPPDFVAWERHSKQKVSDLAEGFGIEDMLYLIWSALKRHPDYGRPPFDVFVGRVVDADIEDADEDAAPFDQEASAGS